jgi:hypothetical protein
MNLPSEVPSSQRYIAFNILKDSNWDDLYLSDLNEVLNIFSLFSKFFFEKKDQ